MNAFEIVFTVVIYLISIVYVYRRGYTKGCKVILNEWKQFTKEMEEAVDDEK